MNEQDLIGKTARIVGIDTSSRIHDFQDFCAHICLDIEGGPRVFVEVLRDGGLRIAENSSSRFDPADPRWKTCLVGCRPAADMHRPDCPNTLRRPSDPPMCPGCGNHTLGDDGECRRERCGYGKPDEVTL